MNLRDAACVVTGGTEGIGRAIVEALLARGAKVALCARTAKHVTSTVKELSRDGATVVGGAADVSSESDVRRFTDLVHAELGQVDVLVNNAGLGHFAPVEKLSLK